MHEYVLLQMNWMIMILILLHTWKKMTLEMDTCNRHAGRAEVYGVFSLLLLTSHHRHID